MSTPLLSSFLMSSYKSHKVDTAKVVLHLTDTAKKCKVEIPTNAAQASDTTTTSDRKSIDHPSLEAGNHSHEHFNNVLGELLAVLTLHSVHVSTERIGDVGDKLKSETAWQTSLGDLELDSWSQEVPTGILRPDDRTEGSDSDPITESQPQAVPSQDAYEVEDPAEYVQFAIFNTTKDLHHLRQHINILLNRYVVKDISLLSLSAIINAAIGAVRRTEKDLMESLPGYSSWEMVMETLVSPAQFKAVFTGSSDYIDKSSQKEFLDSVYCLPFEELRRFRHTVDLDEFPEHLEGQVPISRLEASQVDKIDHWEPEKIILSEFFREVLSLQSTAKLSTEDELTRGVVEVFDHGPIHLWIVFGLQLFLDTQRLLGEHVTRAFRELEATGKVFEPTVKRDTKLSQVIMRSKCTAEEEQNVVRGRFQVIDTWIRKDTILELRQKQLPLGTGRPYFFFSHNPVVCGLFQFASLLSLQRVAILQLNASGYGLSMAHLYTAALSGHFVTIWPDMEKFIEFDKGRLFPAGVPKTIDRCIWNFLRVKGVSAVNFAKDHRSNKVLKQPDDSPGQLETSEMIESFEKLLCGTDNTTGVNADLIETLLHRMAHTQNMKKKEQGLIRERWQKSRTLTPIELLKLLEQCMAEEEPKLLFDYFAIYQSSFLLLASIKVALGTEFTDWLENQFPNFDSNDNRFLSHLPHFLFERIKERNILARIGHVIEDFVSRKAKDPSPSIAGVADDQGLTTDFEHGTQNGVCIHWGRCERTGTLEKQKSD